MAQTGFTPIQLYYSSTAAAAPVAGSLSNGELAINITDGKLYYKDNASAVQVIGYKNVPISTLSGAGSGVLTALGNAVNAAGGFPTTDGVASLTNKEIVKRVVTISSASSITPNIDTTDILVQANTESVGTLTMNAPTGSAVDGQSLVIRLSSTAVQTFSWNAIYQGSADLALPTATSSSSKFDYLGFIYNSTANKWQLLAKNFGF